MPMELLLSKTGRSVRRLATVEFGAEAVNSKKGIRCSYLPTQLTASSLIPQYQVEREQLIMLLEVNINSTNYIEYGSKHEFR